MIAGIFHQGSGLGNQLFRYVATRVLAQDKGYEFGMINPHLFKGDSFMEIDKGIDPATLDYPVEHEDLDRTNFGPLRKVWYEKKVVERHEKGNTFDDVDIRGYDPEINFVEDNTVIDGEFQDPRYFEHRLDEIDKWLKVEPIEIPDDVCVIGFRGGEYSVFPDLYLTKDYWDKGIEIMKEKGITKFEVHTDDPERAKEFFPDYLVIHDVGVNWRSMRYAKNAIIANSSFYILPRLLSKGFTIAPRYWARRNTKVWALPSNYYKSFFYV